VQRKKPFELATLFFIFFLAVTSAVAQQWKFGVMSDTQWIGTDDGRNPGTCAVDIVRDLNQQFINNNVKFVIQVGDLVDQTGSTVQSVANSEDVRAAFAQELYNAGIGFYPLPGNHDSQPLAGQEFVRVYPQTQTGMMNSTPANVFSIPNPDAANQPFPAVVGSPFQLGSNYTTPNPSQTGGQNWRGLSYSFDFNNARFVLLDQFSPLNSTKNWNPFPVAIDLQESWIDGSLNSKSAGTHAFVFGHKGLITENHVDTLFGSDPSQDATGQNNFITSLYSNGVRYYIQGHDHMYDRSVVAVTTGTPTDGKSARVQNLLCASDSSKFYTPGLPSNDDTYDVPAFHHKRQAQVAQELHTVGYYIFTVDGPRVTVDYYSSLLSNVVPNGCSGANCEWLIPTTPVLNFVKNDTFGYSLNGKEFQVCQWAQPTPMAKACNSSYTQVVDTYNGTTAKILGGANHSTAQDYDARSFIKTVDTGWTDKISSTLNNGGIMVSNILTLWGMADLGTDRTDTYTLSMNYTSNVRSGLAGGSYRLITKDSYGNWADSVDMNKGTFSKRFVQGPWNSSYDLGTYGYDPNANTAWAVINYNADFAVASF
jgi:Calcineurin-like phosphoesterase